MAMKILWCWLLSLLAAVSCKASVEGASKKKGLALGAQSYQCGDFDTLRGKAAWWYDWAQFPYYHDPNVCNSTVLENHVPMVWGAWCYGALQVSDDAEYILGFNEPNFYGQANLSPQDAANRWRDLERVAGNRTLVSPAASPCDGSCGLCMSNGVDWFTEFFKACNDCRVDHLATHGYWCNQYDTMGYLQDLWNRFQKPIWFTEFACPKNPSTVADQLNYMKAVLPLLEKASFVYRYSWFAARVWPGWLPGEVSLMELDSTNLTELGRYYMDF